MLDPFFKNGLRFKCMQCSHCCRYSPGYVFLSKEDIIVLLRSSPMSKEDFFSAYLRIVKVNDFYKISLKEKENWDCIFWEDGHCSVYEYRPLQCRSYPFWSSYLVSKQIWDNLKLNCPGIDKGPLHDKNEIEYWIERRKKEKIICHPIKLELSMII